MPHPSRRAVLQASSATLFALLLAPPARAAVSPELARTVQAYLNTLRRSDGGFAWEDQDDSHLTPTFAAIECHHILGLPLTDKPKLAEFIRGAHPLRNRRPERELHLFEQQQIASLVALGEDASGFKPKVSSWTRPEPYLKQYERDQNPVIQQEITAVLCRKLLGMPTDGVASSFLEFFAARRRPNGSYNHTPAAEGSDGHVLNSLWVLLTLRAINQPLASDTLVKWLQDCQLPTGGFTYQPDPTIAGVDDVAYTWAALRCLELLGAAARDKDAAVRYLHSLRTSNGGFSDRPGWNPNPVATHYALDALRAAGALDRDPATPPKSAPPSITLPDNLKVFSALIEAHGQGSPIEAVELARALRIHLWGAKNAKPGWIARAQTLANQRKVPVTFFVANEEYGTWVTVPGLGTYSHTSDIIAPANADIGAPVMRQQNAPTWEEFREQRMKPLEKAGGRLVWQFGENEELTRLYLDDSLARGGYAAISTFHFGNPDFTLSQPFLYRWHGRIPWIALHDAHGVEPWWFSDQTTGFRTLFLATEPTYEGLLTALKHNWTAPVRRDAVTNDKLRMHAGLPAVREFVLKHQDQWKWWGGDNEPSRRPLVAVTVLRPDDEFEVARPEQGLAVRIRCQWENTTQGLPKKPVTELKQVTLDDKPLETRLIERRNANRALADHYHLATLPDDAGQHLLAVTVRHLATGVESTHRVEFTGAR